MITSLKGSNYATWKIQCKMALLKDNLWSIVSGSETAPETTATDKYAKYLCKKDRALAIIVLAVDTSLLYLIDEMDDPCAVWTKLQNNFQKKTWANKLRLRRKLHMTHLKDGNSVSDHIKEMTEMFNALAVIGEPICDDDQSLYLLASLPEAYDSLVTSLQSNEKMPDIDTVRERLLQMEDKFKERAQTKSKSEPESETLLSTKNEFNALTVRRRLTPQKTAGSCILRSCRKNSNAIKRFQEKRNFTLQKKTALDF